MEFSVVERYLTEFRDTKNPYPRGKLYEFVATNCSGHSRLWKYPLLRVIQYDARVRCVDPAEPDAIESICRAIHVPLFQDQHDAFVNEVNTLPDTEFRRLLLELRRTVAQEPPGMAPISAVAFHPAEAEHEQEILALTFEEYLATLDPGELVLDAEEELARQLDFSQLGFEEEEEPIPVSPMPLDEPPSPIPLDEPVSPEDQPSLLMRDQFVRDDKARISVIVTQPTSPAGKLMRAMGDNAEVEKLDLRRATQMNKRDREEFEKRLDSKLPLTKIFTSRVPPFYETPNPPYYDKITNRFVRDRSLVKIYQVAFHFNLWEFIDALKKKEALNLDTGDVGFMRLVDVGRHHLDIPVVVRDGLEPLMNVFGFEFSIPGDKKLCILGPGYGILPRALLFLRAVGSVHCVGDRTLDQEFDSILGKGAYEVEDEFPDFSDYGYVYWNKVWSTAKGDSIKSISTKLLALPQGAVVVGDKELELQKWQPNGFVLLTNESAEMSHGFVGGWITLNKWIRK